MLRSRNQDRLKRQMAEFDNFRKRTEKEKAAMYEIGAKDIIEKILPVLDNFERGLAAVPEDEKGSSFAEGIEKIYKQFVKTLEDAGVETIEAVGQQFDPNLHNAVCMWRMRSMARMKLPWNSEGLQVPRQRGTPQHGSGSKLKPAVILSVLSNICLNRVGGKHHE